MIMLSVKAEVYIDGNQNLYEQGSGMVFVEHHNSDKLSSIEVTGSPMCSIERISICIWNEQRWIGGHRATMYGTSSFYGVNATLVPLNEQHVTANFSTHGVPSLSSIFRKCCINRMVT